MLMRVFRFLDRFIPPALSTTDPDAHRRCRLLVACCFGLILFAFPFLFTVVVLQGYVSPTAWIFLLGSGLTVLNPFLLFYTGSYQLPGILFSLEVIAALAAMACFNGGYQSASLVWNPAIPLLATALVGPVWGATCAGILVVETIVFYLLTEAGYPFPAPFSGEQTRWFQMTGSLMLIMFIAMLSWLYEVLRKNALALVEEGIIALRQREARFRSLIENGSDIIVILNADGTIRYGSPSISRVLGHQPEAQIGHSAFEFIHPEDIPRIGEAFAQLARQPGPGPLVEFRFRHLNGTWCDLEAIGHNLLHDAAVQGIVVNARDVTERKAVDRLKDELVSTVSHELRTPLSSLRGFTELMLSRDFPQQKQQEFLTIMNREAVRLTNMINNFLDLQRIEAGEQTYMLDAIELLPLLQEAVAVFLGAPGTPRVRIVEPSARLYVHADPDRIRQVLANLLSNAVKFSPAGGEVIVAAQQTAGDAVIVISDQGIGIAPEELPALFTKFHRIDNALTRRIGGTGLGLALVKEIVAAHSGRVWVESVVGKGSTFFFTLPIVDGTPQPPPMSSVQYERDARAHCERPDSDLSDSLPHTTGPRCGGTAG